MATDYDGSNIPSVYEESRRLSAETLRRWVLPIAPHVTPSLPLVIDLGCGTGRFVQVLRDVLRAREVLGVDLSPRMLEVAREKEWGRGVRFELGSATSIPVEDGTADLLFMSMVYHHIPDKVAASWEFSRVLCDGGVVAIRTVAPDDAPLLPVLQHFPTALACDLARMPAIEEIAKVLLSVGIEQRAVLKITQQSADTPMSYFEKVSLRGLSSLQGVPPDEFERGLASLRGAMASLPQRDPVYETMTLYVGRKGRNRACRTD